MTPEKMAQMVKDLIEQMVKDLIDNPAALTRMLANMATEAVEMRDEIERLQARVDELEADLDKYKTGAWSNAYEVIKRRVDGVET